MDAVKNNSDDNFLYLPKSDEHQRDESIVALYELSPQYVHNLEPMPIELTLDSIELLDEKLACIFDLFAYEEDSSTQPVI
ncbi:MAG: hypothetical protein KAX49_06905 [Halanaerobiales bacterium]|nr:hypothetical protein [Halanaerobiales bacterium]